MRTFLILKISSGVLFALTFAIIINSKNEAPQVYPEVPPPSSFGVSFEDMTVDGIARCKFRYEKGVGAEFYSKIWGSEQIRVAFDESRYWFWIKSYDPKRHYFCGVSDVEKTTLKPPLRPSFVRWMVNDESQKDGSLILKDGDYEVRIEFMDAAIIEQRYIREGTTEAVVLVRAFQESSGRKFPAFATLEIDGLSIEIDMGRVNSYNPKRPDADPPSGCEGREIAR